MGDVNLKAENGRKEKRENENKIKVFTNSSVMYLSDIKSNSKTVQATSIGYKRPAMLSI